MQALGRSDHIVHLEDTWESNSHLYLQTEFCEEGCLDAFLARQGNCGRLDDFRIWKILLEIAQVSLFNRYGPTELPIYLGQWPAS